MSAEIEHLRAVGRAATEGPWEAHGGYVETVPEFDLHRFDTMGLTVVRAEQGNADAEFCATARNEWDALLDEVEALRAERDKYLAAYSEAFDQRDEYAAECKRLWRMEARIEALAEAAEHADRTSLMRTFDGGTFGAWVSASALRAALADESAQEGLSRPGTTTVASGATGDTGGAQMGAEGIEGDEG